MRVLVTGATGFVGSHLAEALARAGHEVVVTLRGSSDPRWLAGVEVERRLLDLEAPTSAALDLAGVDAVVHAGGITRAPRPEAFTRVNVDGTRALLQASTEAGVRHFVLVSSLAARGPDGADEAFSDYGRSKRSAERVAADFAGAIEVTALRPGAVYGPRDRDMLPVFRLAARGVLVLPAATGRLQPVFAADVAAAVAHVLDRPVGFGPWPVAGPRAYRWHDLPAVLAAAVGRPVRALHLPPAAFLAAATVTEAAARLRGRAPVFDLRRARDVAVHAYTCDMRATEEATGWRARVDLAEGMTRTAHWYREQGWL